MNNKNPNHIAIILDGNKRWASKNKLSLLEGYKKGLEKIKIITNSNLEKKIPYLTLFTLSSENISRTSIHNIYKIILDHFEKFLLDIIVEKKIKIKIIGRRNNLPKKIVDIITECEKLTSNNTGLILNVALNYGGRDEIVRAVRNITEEVKAGNILPENVDESLISANTYTAGIADPDLVIRTSGELRISNFLIWQSAYSEYYFTDILWPDFTKENLYEAIVSFQQRKRRLGRSSISEHTTKSKKVFSLSKSTKKEKSTPKIHNSEI